MLTTTQRPNYLLILGLAVMLCGCRRQPPVAEVPPLEVEVSQAAAEDIELWDEYTGTLEAKDSVELRSRVRGHILKAPLKEGTEIKAGTVLYQIDQQPFQADLERATGELKSFEADLELAEKQIKLYTPLAEMGTVSKEDLFKVFASKERALGNIATANGKILEAKLNIGYCKITAPIDGRVGESLLSPGDLVNASGADSQLTTITAVDPMYVHFNVNERKYEEYREILRKDPTYQKVLKEYEALIEAKGEKYKEALEEKGEEYRELLKTHPQFKDLDKPRIPVKLYVVGRKDPYPGVVDFVDSRVAATTGSIKVRARFENPKEAGLRRLTAGQFARIRVSIVPKRPALLVADRAILTDQSLKYVLVVNRANGNKVERRDIQTSERLEENGLREVLGDALTKEDWIIVEGVNRVRPTMIVVPTEKKMPRLSAE